MRAALRFDAGPELGFGHAHRCLALAVALEARGVATVILTKTADAVARLNPDLPLIRIDDDEVAAVARAARGADLVILDYLDPPADRITDVRRRLAGSRLVLIGNREPASAADCVVRQSVTSPPDDAGVIGGPAMLLLKPEFQGLPRRATPGGASTALVCLGGGRPRGLARLVALLDAGAPETLKTVHVIGAGADAAIPDQPRRRFVVADRIDDMAGAMLKADIGLIAAGGLVHEAAACGLPALYCPVVAHQEPLAAEAERAGLGLVSGRPETMAAADLTAPLNRLLSDAALRAGMTRTGQSLVDGRGADRVAEALIALIRAGQD